MKKKYLALLIVPLLVGGISSCDSITIMDSREDINPSGGSTTSEEDLNTYSIEVESYPETVEVGKAKPIEVYLITKSEEDTLIEAGTSKDVLLISSDPDTLNVNKMDVVGVKNGKADITVRWASHPEASITIKDIEVVTGYTFDVYFALSGDDEDDRTTSISINIEDTLDFTDFDILLGTLEDDGVNPVYTQMDINDDDYKGNDVVTFISSDESILEVSSDGTTVTGTSAGRANLSIYWADHDVYSDSIRVTIIAEEEPDPEGDPE